MTDVDRPNINRVLKLKGLEEARARLHSHPGFVEHQRVAAFALTLTAVFRSNRESLLVLLRRAATDESLQVHLIQNVARPDVRNAFNASVIRALHNYVASTMTLVEHSRRLMRHQGDALQHDFAEKQAELLLHPEVRFIQDLRNFMLHRSLPFLGQTLSMSDLDTQEPKIDMRIELSVAELLEDDAWSASSKSFLSERDGKLHVLPVIEEHGELVFKFNAWLVSALNEANKDELAEANQIMVELNAIMGGFDMEQAGRFTEEMTRRREQVAFPPPPDDLPFGIKLPDEPTAT